MLLKTMDVFCAASRLHVNFEKSRALCSKNVSRQRREILTFVSTVRFTTNLGKYLGVPLIQGRASRSMFYGVLEKIQKRLDI